jgi:hypothetical protein
MIEIFPFKTRNIDESIKQFVLTNKNGVWIVVDCYRSLLVSHLIPEQIQQEIHF